MPKPAKPAKPAQAKEQISSKHRKTQSANGPPVMQSVRVACMPPGGMDKADSGVVEKSSFIMKDLPYDEWRKHYAKDREGRFRGTEEPADDCLLKGGDFLKWRVEPRGWEKVWDEATGMAHLVGEIADETPLSPVTVEKDKSATLLRAEPQQHITPVESQTPANAPLPLWSSPSRPKDPDEHVGAEKTSRRNSWQQKFKKGLGWRSLRG